MMERCDSTAGFISKCNCPADGDNLLFKQSQQSLDMCSMLFTIKQAWLLGPATLRATAPTPSAVLAEQQAPHTTFMLAAPGGNQCAVKQHCTSKLPCTVSLYSTLQCNGLHRSFSVTLLSLQGLGCPVLTADTEATGSLCQLALVST